MNKPKRPMLNRAELKFKPLSQRKNRQMADRDMIDVSKEPHPLTDDSAKVLALAIQRIKKAKEQKKPVIMAFGAHTIKNGLGPVLIKLIEEGWVTHLATNGAGVIHDWEFSYLGQTSEHVQENVKKGEFGNWEETGRYINMAINVGAYEGLGYGEAVGSLILNEGFRIPTVDELNHDLPALIKDDPDKAAAGADLLYLHKNFKLSSGWNSVKHSWKQFSIQAASLKLGVPFTSHPMFGHDIIYNHPLNCGAAIGRAAQRDFLCFAEGVSRISGGVYLSVGSAVMSPMIFEKSMSMAQNLALQRGEEMKNHFILVVDVAPATWDWAKGEPPEHNPAYYQRYNKSFNRMGGEMRYLSADNRDFLLSLYQQLHR